MIDLLALLVQDPGAAAQPPPPVAAAPAAGGSSAFWDGLMGQLPFLLFFLIFLIPGILRSRAAADFERRV